MVKAITKNKPDQALSILREVDATGSKAKTLSLAGHATWLKAKSSGSKSDYRRSAKLFRDSFKLNPRDKQANSAFNDLKNDMNFSREYSYSKVTLHTGHILTSLSSTLFRHSEHTVLNDFKKPTVIIAILLNNSYRCETTTTHGYHATSYKYYEPKYFL